MNQWESLFYQAVSMINQANPSFKLLDSWTFRGWHCPYAGARFLTGRPGLTADGSLDKRRRAM